MCILLLCMCVRLATTVYILASYSYVCKNCFTGMIKKSDQDSVADLHIPRIPFGCDKNHGNLDHNNQLNNHNINVYTHRLASVPNCCQPT